VSQASGDVDPLQQPSQAFGSAVFSATSSGGCGVAAAASDNDNDKHNGVVAPAAGGSPGHNVVDVDNESNCATLSNQSLDLTARERVLTVSSSRCSSCFFAVQSSRSPPN
jgi:hypothetical protein